MTLLVLLLFVAVPGLGITLALYPPGALSLPLRLALTFALGFVVTGGIAFLLTILSILAPMPFFVLLGVATVGAWVVAMRRATLGEHLRALSAELRADRGTLLVGLLAIAAIAAMRAGYLADVPAGSQFRYWVDGMELADAGGIPAKTLHYGALFEPVTSKMFLNAFTAGAHFLTSRDVGGAIQAMLWIGAVGTAVGLWATARELGLRFTAALVPVLLISNRVVFGDEMTLDLNEYRAEAVGRMIAFCILPLALNALREKRRRRDLVVAAVGFGAAAGTHLISFGAAAIIVGWFFLALLASERGWWRVRHAAGLFVLTGVVAAAVLLSPRGGLGFGGAADPDSYRRTDVRFDKSRFLYSGSTAPADEPARGAFYVPPGGVVHAFVQEAFAWEAGSPLAGRTGNIAVGLGGLAAAALIFLRFPRQLRPIGPVALGLAGTLIATAMAFSYAYDVFIPATFGVRRLTDYAPLALVLVVAAVLEAVILVWRVRRPAAATAVGLAVALSVPALVVPSAQVPHEQIRHSYRALEAFSWVRQNTPCRARILANQRTVGAFRVLTGRAAVLEGMGPFLRPQMLDIIVDKLLGARAFFADPGPNARFLVEEGVDFVILAKGFRLGSTPEVGRVPRPQALRGVPFLQPVHRSATFDVYRVTGLPERGRFPDPSDHPAYHCRTGTIR